MFHVEHPGAGELTTAFGAALERPTFHVKHSAWARRAHVKSTRGFARCSIGSTCSTRRGPFLLRPTGLPRLRVPPRMNPFGVLQAVDPAPTSLYAFQHHCNNERVE